MSNALKSYNEDAIAEQVMSKLVVPDTGRQPGHAKIQAENSRLLDRNTEFDMKR